MKTTGAEETEALKGKFVMSLQLGTVNSYSQKDSP